ncbi:hypothetical protein DPMN_079317 [Dreissena polymorpha]|uniref:Uncharacterized protein n=1 Tax=Dreissena polymorpha TaxID=45954 RepID=A0A9D3YTJ6_DREPO|nr:hypothetical protein DPMN_079317 [Dreissena polymorpha]
MDNDDTQVIISSHWETGTDIENTSGIRVDHSNVPTFDLTQVPSPGFIKPRREHIEAKDLGLYHPLLDVPTRRKPSDATDAEIIIFLQKAYFAHESIQTRLDKRLTDTVTRRSINPNTRTVSLLEIERLVETLRHVMPEDLLEEFATARAFRESLQCVVMLQNPQMTSENLALINVIIESVIRRRLETWTGKRSRFQAWGGKRKRGVSEGA